MCGFAHTSVTSSPAPRPLLAASYPFPVLMRLLRLLVFCAALLAPAAARAQPGDRPDRAERMVERRVDRLASVLDLSEAQAERVRALLHARVSDARHRADEVRRALDGRCGAPGTRPEAEQRACVRRAMQELRVEAPHERMRRENEQTAVRIRALLTPAQAARFDAFVREEQARFERRLPDRTRSRFGPLGRPEGKRPPGGPPPGGPPPGGDGR